MWCSAQFCSAKIGYRQCACDFGTRPVPKSGRGSRPSHMWTVVRTAHFRPNGGVYSGALA